MWKQIKFRVKSESGFENEITYGFAKIDYDGNVFDVICGCCGGEFNPEDIEILAIYSDWVDLTEWIKE